jgi:hypothetical protein
MDFYKTSFNFSLDMRPLITKLQSLLQDKEKKAITKGEAIEKAVAFYIKSLEGEK